MNHQGHIWNTWKTLKRKTKPCLQIVAELQKKKVRVTFQSPQLLKVEVFTVISAAKTKIHLKDEETDHNQVSLGLRQKEGRAREGC